MSASEFVYVTYIRTTPRKLWDALITPETTRQFWLGTHLESDWKKGAAWQMISADGKVSDGGEIVEVIPERKLVLTWSHQNRPELKAEGVTRMTLEIESSGNAVKLTVRHQSDVADSKLIHAVSGGWPVILSNLKSLLENGQSIPEIKEWSCGGAKRQTASAAS